MDQITLTQEILISLEQQTLGTGSFGRKTLKALNPSTLRKLGNRGEMIGISENSENLLITKGIG